MATSEPVPVITWYRNERALTSDDADKYEFTEEGLKIKRAQRKKPKVEARAN